MVRKQAKYFNFKLIYTSVLSTDVDFSIQKSKSLNHWKKETKFSEPMERFVLLQSAPSSTFTLAEKAVNLENSVKIFGKYGKLNGKPRTLPAY